MIRDRCSRATNIDGFIRDMGSHVHARSICPGSAMSNAFSALHLLRSYRLLGPTSDFCRYEPYPPRDCTFGDSSVLTNSSMIESPCSPLTSPSLSTTFSLPGELFQPSFLSTMPPLMQPVNLPQTLSDSANLGGVVTRQFVNSNGITSTHKRPRSEKKPIPDDQKDEKYYERRKRNNQAAKKSRDARKIREDHIALRATMLEHENAILRAQVLTLREEAQSLRHMLFKQQTTRMQSIERSVSSITASPAHPTNVLDCQV